MNQIIVQNTPISVLSDAGRDFICLTDMAGAKSDEVRAADVIKNWLRNRYTIEFLGIWEKVHNPNFNSVEFDIIKSQAGLHNSLSMKVYRNKSACTNSTRLPFSK